MEVDINGGNNRSCPGSRLDNMGLLLSAWVGKPPLIVKDQRIRFSRECRGSAYPK
jgi:hypothetical protein